MVTHIVPDYTIGEKCSSCGKPASHKVAEEARMVFDKPGQVVRHPFTTYLCCHCFSALMGSSASEACWLTQRAADGAWTCPHGKFSEEVCDECGKSSIPPRR